MYFALRGKDPEVNYNYYDERIAAIQADLKAADTPDKQFDAMLKIKEIMQRETLFDVQFYAFLNAYVNKVTL